jgi:hypothetical protein
MNKLSPRQKAAAELPDAQRKLCGDWLLNIAISSPKKRLA